MSGVDQPSPALQSAIDLCNQGRLMDAIPMLSDYLSGNPLDQTARNYLAACYAQTGNQSQAIQEFSRLVEFDPRNAQYHFNLGIAYEGAGDIEQARDSFERALAANSGYQKARQKLNAINARLGVQDSGSDSVDVLHMSGSSMAPPPAASPMSQAPAYGPSSTAAPGPAQPPRPSLSGPVSAPEGLNWGGFLMPFWWSIAHSAWIWTIISFIAGPIASIVLLITGNKVACESRTFDSMDEFRSVQKAWTIWGLVINGIWLVGMFIFWGTIGAMIFGTAMKTGANGAMPTMSTMPGMGQMFSTALPKSGEVANIPIYTGAKQDGSPSKGSDTDGSYTATRYTVAADFNKVLEYYNAVGKSGSNYSSSSDGSKADMVIGGWSKMHIESNGSGTSFTIYQYK